MLPMWWNKDEYIIVLIRRVYAAESLVAAVSVLSVLDALCIIALAAMMFIFCRRRRLTNLSNRQISQHHNYEPSSMTVCFTTSFLVLLSNSASIGLYMHHYFTGSRQSKKTNKKTTSKRNHSEINIAKEINTIPPWWHHACTWQQAWLDGSKTFQ